MAAFFNKLGYFGIALASAGAVVNATLYNGKLESILHHAPGGFGVCLGCQCCVAHVLLCLRGARVLCV